MFSFFVKQNKSEKIKIFYKFEKKKQLKILKYFKKKIKKKKKKKKKKNQDIQQVQFKTIDAHALESDIVHHEQKSKLYISITHSQ